MLYLNKSIDSEVIYVQPVGVRGLVDLTYTQENSSQVKFIYWKDFSQDLKTYILKW